MYRQGRGTGLMMMGLRHLSGMTLLVLLAGCGPIPVHQAEQVCLRDAQLAKRPGGEIAMGVGTGGGGVRTMGRFEVEISSDYIFGRDPSDVFARCVQRRSGQLPTRSLADQPDWRR